MRKSDPPNDLRYYIYWHSGEKWHPMLNARSMFELVDKWHEWDGIKDGQHFAVYLGSVHGGTLKRITQWRGGNVDLP